MAKIHVESLGFEDIYDKWMSVKEKPFWIDYSSYHRLWSYHIFVFFYHKISYIM